ncbi:hypothetical protein BE22_0058 [Staphylococcus phage vB_SepS_BE22]|nr:hypothetical protein BE22_0058 [Staphylococcus phage vB_SepS_BE22]
MYTWHVQTYKIFIEILHHGWSNKRSGNIRVVS